MKLVGGALVTSALGLVGPRKARAEDFELEGASRRCRKKGGDFWQEKGKCRICCGEGKRRRRACCGRRGCNCCRRHQRCRANGRCV
jgi:hypothetical protein